MASTKSDKRFRVTPDQIFAAVGKKGKTVGDIKTSLGVTPATVRKYLAQLEAENRVKVEGVRETGARGRPAALYFQA